MQSLWKILKWALSIVVILFITAASLLYFNQDKIIALVIGQVNERLLAPVEVGSIEISLQKFPRAAVKMNEVFTAGLPATHSDTLVYAQEVFLAFNLWDVFTGTISIEEISIEHGTLSLLTTANGLSNFDLIKPQEQASSEAEGINLEAVHLKDIKTNYTNESKDIALKGHCHSITAQGQFKDRLILESQVKVQVLSYQQDGEMYVAAPLWLEGALAFENGGTSLRLASRNLQLDQNLVFDFSYQNQPQKQELLWQSVVLNLEDVLPFIKEQGWFNPSALTAQGALQAQAKLDLRPKESILQINFSGQNTQVSWAENQPLQNLSFKGRYSRHGSTDELEITELESNDGTRNIRGSALLHDLPHPSVQARLTADMPLLDWANYLSLDTLQALEGNMAAQLELKGQFDDLTAITKTELAQSTLSGTLKFKDGAFALKESSQAVENLRGELSLNGKNLLVNNLYFTSGPSDLYLKGSLGNTLNYLFFQNETLAVNVLVKSQEVVLDHFLQNSKSTNPGNYSLSFTRQLKLSLQLEIDQFAFAEFKAEKIRGLLEIEEGQIRARQLSMRAQGGAYQGSFSLDPTATKGYQLTASLEAQKLDMRALFAGFQNFNQQTLTANNLIGTAWVSTQINALLDSNLVMDPYSIAARANLRLKDGHLKNYEPMKALSRFAEIEELEDVAFSELSNTITINQGLITIPNMDIQSNVLNLQLQGTHSFENDIDYLVKLRLSDVLFKEKDHRPNAEFQEHLALAQKDDHHRIPVSITGTTNNPQIKITRKELGKSIGDDLKKQGQELKEIFKKDPPKKEKTGIIYEWDGG